MAVTGLRRGFASLSVHSTTDPTSRRGLGVTEPAVISRSVWVNSGPENGTVDGTPRGYGGRGRQVGAVTSPSVWTLSSSLSWSLLPPRQPSNLTHLSVPLLRSVPSTLYYCIHSLRLVKVQQCWSCGRKPAAGSMAKGNCSLDLPPNLRSGGWQFSHSTGAPNLMEDRQPSGRRWKRSPAVVSIYIHIHKSSFRSMETREKAGVC